MIKYIFILLFIGTGSFCRSQQQNTNDMIERFDFSLVEGKTNDIYLEESNGWTKMIYIQKDYIMEYAPAKSFYMIMKQFHTNGIIRSRGKILGRVKFGIWEYFDENGKLTESVDEDKKFGKIKPEDVLEFIDLQGIINRQNGTTIMYPYQNKELGTSGTFYSMIVGPLMIDFKPAETDESGKEITPCYWKVSYEDASYSHHFRIDGNTGEWTEQLLSIIRIR